MITTSEIAPSPLLAPYVRAYIYREFNTYGADFVKPKHAVQEIALHFFFEGLPVKLVDPSGKKVLKTGKRGGVSGLTSEHIGDMTFNGFYAFFEIAFKPNGFSTVFDIPSHVIMNRIVWSEEVFGHDMDDLHDQLHEAAGPADMARLAERYLFMQLNRKKYVDHKDRIGYMVNAIDNYHGLIHIDRLASDVNMSVRNMERHFHHEIGITPKQFCCITRFNYALSLKLRNPALDWTSVAYLSGYFDQMHLTKDFKKFSGDAPYTLLKETPLFVETYKGRTDPLQ